VIDREPKPPLHLGDVDVLSVALLRFRVREQHDAVSREGGQRVGDRLDGSLSPVSALARTPASPS
jgi:hypothetical protein